MHLIIGVTARTYLRISEEITSYEVGYRYNSTNTSDLPGKTLLSWQISAMEDEIQC